MSDLTLGILETGLVDDSLQDRFCNYPEMFQSLFNQCDNPPKYRSYNVIEGEYPEDMDECDAYLITGSKSDSFSDESWVVKLREYVVELHQSGKKMIGICFGHQLIAHALGGTAGRSDKGWGVGVYSSEITADSTLPWLNGCTTFNLNVIHQDQVLKLPEGATSLGQNAFCQYSAYYIENLALCFQGHPEFTKDYTEALMQSRQARIGEPTYSKAVESFTEPTDHLMVAKIILDFLRN